MRFSNRDRFCTAAYGTLESDGAVWWLNTAAAGHPLPVVARSGGAAAVLGTPGSLLGVFEQIQLEVATVALAVGDVVVLYTDGLTDLPPPHGRTEADVVALVAEVASGRSAAEIAEAIHDALTRRLPLAQRADDVALVVLRVTAPPDRAIG
jgi:sigma-B regulation protein RsbU (phosphoserine phosphatase)